MSARQATAEWYESDPVDVASRRTRTSGLYSISSLGLLAASTRAAKEPLIEAINRRLDQLSAYQQGWDGQGSDAPSAEALANARQFLQEAFRSALRHSVSSEWQRPHITANEDGQIVFEWWNGNRKLTLYLGSDNSSYIKSWGPHIINDMQDGEFTPEEFGVHWAWLFG